MLNKIVLFCLLSVTGIQCAYAEKWLKQYHQQISQQAKKYNLPGFAWTYVDENNKEYTFLYGKTAKSGGKIQSDTVFRLASVSKTFTAALVAKWVERKRLSWNTRVSTLAPEFVSSPTANIRLSHIIGQSSGFMRNAYDNVIEANYKPERVLSMLANLDPLCQPGKCYTYQNALMATLDSFFERQNTSYAEQVQQSVFSPLKMRQASVGRNALQSAKSWAKPHVAVARNHYKQTSVKNAYYLYAPAAGINASIQDMAIWIQTMLGRHPHVLSQHSINDLIKPGIKTRKELRRRHWRELLTDAHYGLGWRIYQLGEKTLVYHGGWVQGYRADVAFAPEQGVGFSMLINAETNLINQFTAQFWQAYFSRKG